MCLTLDSDISVKILKLGTALLGQDHYRFQCMLMGLKDNLKASVMYQWTKNGGTQTNQLQSNSQTLSFGPLRLTDAGNYTCQVRVSSDHLSRDIIVTSFRVVRFQSKLRKL